ncbi:MAG: hypothetical protein ACOYN6_07990 [Ignavibacteria bacterium]
MKYTKKPETKTRYNLVSYSKPVYESERFNPLSKRFIYTGRNRNVRAITERSSGMQFSWNGRNLSSVFFINFEHPAFAYADVDKTEDLILIIMDKVTIEMFILKDKISHLQAVLDLWIDEELNQEIKYFRDSAVNLDSEE